MYRIVADDEPFDGSQITAPAWVGRQIEEWQMFSGIAPVHSRAGTAIRDNRKVVVQTNCENCGAPHEGHRVNCSYCGSLYKG